MSTLSQVPAFNLSLGMAYIQYSHTYISPNSNATPFLTVELVRQIIYSHARTFVKLREPDGH